MRGWHALLALACAAAALPVASQEPLPPAIPGGPVRSAVPAATLIVEVVDSEGQPVAGAVIEIDPAEGGPTSTFTTDETGRVRVPSIPAGTYEVEARLEGFSAARSSVSIAPGRSQVLTITFGGPVPGGIGRSGRTERPAVEVESLTTSDELAVQSLLTTRADEGWQLSSTLVGKDGGTLFVFYRDAGSAACLTQVVGGEVGGDELARRLALMPNLRLRGAHGLAADRLVLLLCEP